MKTKTGQNARLLKAFLPYFKKYRLTLFCDLFCAALTTVCELVLPMIARQITDLATTNIALLTTKFILRCTLLYIVLRIIDTLANYYMASVGHIMGTKIETDMRHDFFAHLQKLSFSYYDNAKIGTLMSRITSDLFDITEFAHHCPEEFFIAGIKIIASIAVICVGTLLIILCTINVPLTIIVFAIIPPMVIVMSFFRKRMKEGFRESRKQVGELNAQVEDSLLGIRVVKSFAKENLEQQKFDNGNKIFLKVKTKVYHIMGSFQSCTRLFDGLMYIVVVAAGAFFLKSGAGIEIARTSALVTLVMSQLIHVFECKSEKKNIFTVNLMNNKKLIFAVIISAIALFASMYIPFLSSVFTNVPLTMRELIISLGFSLFVPVVSGLFSMILGIGKKD